MARNVASAARVSVLEPCTTDICVLFVDDVLDVLEMLLNMVCIHDSCDALL
jgi:hypothetical protein